MAQFNDKVDGLNSYTKEGTINSTVNINGLNIKGVSNITLLDYTDAVIKKGSEISSSLDKNAEYSIYGAPAKWVYDKRQQYNNCGVESCLNVLSTAGVYDIKDQTTDENEFTLWAITNTYIDEYGDEYTYAEDYPEYGVLDYDDGGTSYYDRRAIFEYYDIESESVLGLNSEHKEWFHRAYNEPNSELKSLYKEYDSLVDEYNELVEQYNSLYEAGNETEANKIKEQLELLAIQIDVAYQSYYDKSAELWNIEFKKNYSDLDLVNAMANHLKEGKAVIAVGDAKYLWNSDEYGLWHAILIAGAVYDSEDNVVGFYVQDTGSYKIGFAFVSSDKMIEFMTAGGNDYWTGPTTMNVTSEPIKDWADFLNATGNNSNNIINGNDSKNILNGLGGNDQLFGNAGDDELYGGDGNDSLDGGEGVDVLDGGAGDDTLYGSAGEDVLNGGDGNDTYVFSKNCGNDVINFGTNGYDKIIFTDVEFNDLHCEKNDLDLVITYNQVVNESNPEAEPVAETVTVKDYFKGDNHIYMVDIQDSSGETKKLQSLIVGVIEYEFNENEATLIHGTFFSDKIIAPETNTFNDTIYGGSGDDTIKTFGGDDLIYGDSYDEENIFSNEVYGDTYNDYIVGGQGNDTIYGEAGNNIIEFNNGDGNDVIYSGAGTDSLLFTDVNYDNLEFTFKGDNLVIKYGVDNQVTIVNYLKDGNISSSVKYIVDANDDKYTLSDYLSGFEIAGKDDEPNTLIGSALSDTITGSNLSDVLIGNGGNDYINAQEGNDTIYGVSGDNIISGGAGNDEIYVGVGNDIVEAGSGKDKIYSNVGNHQFIFYANSGNDTIYSGTGSDTIVLKDVEVADLTFVNDNNGNLVIEFNDGSITLDKYFEKLGDCSVRNLIDSTGKNYYIGNLLEDIIIERDSDYDYEINGTYLSESLVGDDNNDTIYGRLGNDTLNGNVGNDKLLAGDGDDVVYGGEGNDELYGENGNNILYGGTGDDTLNGGSGENKIYFKAGDGNDVVLIGSGIDTLVFEDFKFSDLEYTKDAYSNDLIIRYGNKDGEGKYTDSVRIKDYFDLKVKKSVYKIEAKADTIGEDYISREVNFVINDSNTVILIESPDYQVNNIVGSVYDDVITGGDALQFTNNIYNGGNGNDTISGGSREDLIYGGYGNDELHGGADRDTIYGGGDDDVIYGDGGSDLIYGEAGENTIHFAIVENPEKDAHLLNHDTIVSGKGTDILVFDVSYEDLAFYQDGNHLVIKYGDTDDLKDNNSVLIYNYFKNKGNVSVKTIITTESDGSEKVSNLASVITDKVLTVIANNDVRNKIVGSYNDDSITGGNLSDTLYGANGNDEINGNDGNDYLYGDNGNDTIYGEAGNDYIKGGNGNDSIEGGNNNDTIYGNSGNDTITGGKGDDRLYGEQGTNTFKFSLYDENDTVYSGKGSDILKFTDVSFEDMKFIRSGNDLIIQYNGSDDTVTLSNYLKSSKNSIKTLVDENDESHYIQSEAIVAFDGNLGSKNKINGSFMNDSITAGYYKDTVSGGNGNDRIYGNKGNDSLLGGNGNDVIYGDMVTPDGASGTYDDNDTIKGGNGNDSIYGGYGNDKLYGDKGTNNLYFNVTDYDGNDTVYSSKGYDILNFKDLELADLRFTRSGKNLVIAYDNSGKTNYVTISNYFANTKSSVKSIETTDRSHTTLSDSAIQVAINGNVSKKNKITGTFLNDSLNGGNYNDTLNGGNGNDTISGGLGNDIIKGGNGNDTIIGGAGNDKLYGDSGNDTYKFEVGSGQDTIYIGKGSDTLVFNDLAQGDVTISRNSNNLVLSYGTNDSVVVSNYFKTNGEVNMFAEFEFTDGTFDLRDLYNSSVIAREIESSSKKLKGSNYNDEITVIGSKQKVYGYGGNDIINGSANNETIYGGLGDDTINSNAGNDKIYGEAGTNTINFVEGDGRDTVYSGKGRDILNIDDLFEDLKFSRSGKNLVISYGEAGDAVVISNYFANTKSSVKSIDTTDGSHTILSDLEIQVAINGNVSKKNKITGTFLHDNIIGGNKNDTINGGNGNDSINGGYGNDIIKGGNGDDTIIGGAGNDKLYGDSGNDTFEFDSLSGNDTVYSGKGSDSLKFTDAEFGNLEFTNDSKNNLIIKVKDDSGNYTNSVNIANYFKLKGKTSIVNIVDKNGEAYTIQQKDGQIVFVDSSLNEHFVELYSIGKSNSKNKMNGTYLNDSMNGGNKNDTINGGNGNDTIVGGFGNDIIKSGNQDDIVYGDLLDYSNYLGGKDKIYGGSGNDTIYGGVGNDTLYGENDSDSIEGGQGNDSILGGNGNDILLGNEGNDVVLGGSGDDTIYGGSGDDKIYGEAGYNYIHFKNGDGQDIVYAGKGTDTLVFDDVVAFDNLKMQNSGGNLVISYNESNLYDNVIISNFFKKSSSVKYIQIGNDPANKKLLSELLTQDGSYVLMNGSVNKKNSLSGTVYNDSLTGGNLADTIKSGNGHDVIDGGNGNDKLYGGYGRDTIYGGAGNDYIEGNAENDSLSGGDGNDTIKAGHGDDNIEGNRGNDYLYGEEGINTFKFAIGDGNDVIYSGKGQDILDFGYLKLESDFRFVKNGNDLIIYYGENSNPKVDSVTISSYFKGVCSVNTIIATLNDERTTVNIKDIAFVEINGNYGSKNNISGSVFDDIITGGSYVDTISGGDGADIIKGGAGADLLSGNRDNDKIYGESGNDVIYGGLGDDTIVGGLDNDQMNGEAGNNVFEFKAGDGRDTIYSGNGTDTLVFEDITAEDLNFVYDKNSGSLIINYGSNGYDYVYLDSYIENYGETSVKYIETQDPFDSSHTISNKLIDLVNDSKVNISAEANDTTEGTLFNDEITSTNLGAVDINSQSGNDSIVGGDFDDTINAGSDNDTVSGGAGNDVIYGGAGDDSIYGGAGDFNYLYGDSGNDTLFGDINSHYDYLYGGAGDDVINVESKYFSEAYGGEGNDIYNINLKGAKISDTAGQADVINISADNADIGIFFNVDNGGEQSSDLFLYDATKLDGILEEFENTESLPLDEMVQVKSYFGKGKIEEIKANDGYYFTSTQIDTIRANVVSWLNTTDYTSTQEVLETKDASLIAQMLINYQMNDWQSQTP